MKRSLSFFLLLCFSCTHKPQVPAVHISLINNNSAVKFTGLDYAIISEINRDSIQETWQGLLPVFLMPADTDMKGYQPVQPGKYQLKDSAVVFTPDTPFVKNRTYFMRYYQFGESKGAWDYIKGKKKLGGVHYIDLPFYLVNGE
jgi:hypothetical protein